jgi:hypothetical protein
MQAAVTMQHISEVIFGDILIMYERKDNRFTSFLNQQNKCKEL